MDEMKKYIIEFSEDPYTIRLMIIKNGDKCPITEFKIVRPYTEPDLEQVRKEAYENGRKYGKVEGRAETWVCVKKIAFNPESVECVDDLVRMGFDVGDGNGWSEAIEELFEKYTATEAIEKIRQHEQRQEEQIQVGDEVITASGKAVVTGVGPVHFEYDYADGSHGYDEVKNVKKTGRNFPEIAEVLRKMRESE